jgi:hypothetical protein
VTGPGTPGGPPAGGPPRGGKAQADRELRIALAVALPLLLVGQILLLTGLRWVALVGIALPGTAVALLLARRWQAMASQGP